MDKVRKMPCCIMKEVLIMQNILLFLITVLVFSPLYVQTLEKIK
jgi:hypothetical protein